MLDEIGLLEIVIGSFIALLATIFGSVLGLLTWTVKKLANKQNEANTLGVQGVDIHAGNTLMNAKMLEVMDRMNDMLVGLVEIHKDENSAFATIKLSEKLTEMDKYMSQAKIEIAETKILAIKLSEKSTSIIEAVHAVPEKVRNLIK